MKKPFLVFLAVLGVLVATTLWFIQSARFARLFKGAVAQYLPGDLGVDVDFTEFAIKMFPPGISLKNPKIALRDRNVAKLPAGSAVTAERIDFNFAPFQVFTGNVRVHEVVIVRGDVKLLLDEAALNKKPAKKSAPFEFHWDELLQIRAEAVALEDTKFHLEVMNATVSAPPKRLDFVATSLRVGQWTGKGGLGYELGIDLRDVRAQGFAKDLPRVDRIELSRASARVHLNSLGADIESVEVALAGLAAKASGHVQGDVLHNPKSLALEAVAEADADLSRVAALLPATPSASGRVSFRGRVKGDLLRVAETLHAEGRLGGKDIRYDRWEADSVDAEGSYLAAPRGGEIRVAHASVAAAERERRHVMPQAVGRGGQVEISDFRMRIGQTEPIVANLALKRAHIHWLAAPALKQVFPLELRATGPVTATFTPPARKGAPWALRTSLKLAVEDFRMDNQHLGASKELFRVLQVPRIQLEGNVNVDPTGIRPENVTLSLPNTRLKLDGRIDFKRGFDLHASGPARLADLGQIAQKDIRGDGMLVAHVHGPGSAVVLDFDVDLQNAYYLRLKFGAFRGRITWEDGPDHLVFTQVKLTKGRTAYTGDGRVYMGKEDRVAINIQVPEGNIGDMTGIFEEMTDKISWFPRTLGGLVSGEVQILGGLDMDRLEVMADLTGNGWEYLGERFESVSLQGGYDRGRFHISGFKGLKRTGRVLGRVSYDADDRISWELQTQGFTVNDLDHVAQLDVPIRGKLALESVGKGRLGAVQSQTRAFLTELAVRGVPMAPSQFLMRSEAGRTEVRASALGGQGALELDYDSRPGAASQLHGELKHLDFSPVLLLLNPKSIPDPALTGLISGAMNLGFRSGEFERATGEVALTEYTLAKSGAAFRLGHPVSFRVADGSFDVRDLSLVGNGREATVNLRSRQARIDGTIGGEADLSMAEFLTSSVAKASGAAALDFTIGGTLKEPAFQGQATIDGALLRVPAVESAFENITGALRVKQNVLTAQKLTADLAGGRVTADGTITLFADRVPELALRADLSGSRLKVFPFQYAKSRGSLKITGDRLPYLIEGKVTVDSALSTEKIFSQKRSVGSTSVQYPPPPSTRRSSDVSKFRLKIDVAAPGGIVIKNELFDLEAKADVTVVNTLDAPRIIGSAELVQGRLLYKDRAFRIQSAALEFDNPTAINPRFNLTAFTEVNGVKVQLYAQGRLDDQWKIDLSSTPVMGESEILSLLTLGMSSSESKRLSSSDRSTFEQGEAASLLLHSLDFNREFESKTGVQIQLDETVNTQLGTSVFRPSSPNDTAASPKIVIRKRINKNVDLSVGSTVGVGTNSQKEVNAEVKVTPGFSINGVYDYLESDTAQGNRTSYGMDLKLQKRFK